MNNWPERQNNQNNKTRTLSQLFHSHKMYLLVHLGLLMTEMTDFPTLKYTSTSKILTLSFRHPSWAEPPHIGHCGECPPGGLTFTLLGWPHRKSSLTPIWEPPVSAVSTSVLKTCKLNEVVFLKLNKGRKVLNLHYYDYIEINHSSPSFLILLSPNVALQNCSLLVLFLFIFLSLTQRNIH